MLADEIAFWHTATDYAEPDVEILAAARPGLLTTNGPLLMISSAYAQHGELFDAYKRYFGPAGPPDILVAHGTSRDLNPSLDQAEIDRALEKDPVLAIALSTASANGAPTSRFIPARDRRGLCR